jgi:hypothetical protein
MIQVVSNTSRWLRRPAVLTSPTRAEFDGFSVTQLSLPAFNELSYEIQTDAPTVELSE